MQLTKRLFLGILALSLSVFGGFHAGAWAIKAFPSNAVKTAGIHIVGAEENSKDVNAIMDILNQMVQASNRHDLDGVLKYYSSRFISGDNLNLDAIQHLILDTWKIYPDIHYDTKPLEIRVNGDWATVESLDFSKAKLTESANSFNLPGTLESESRGMLFLRRLGKTWQVLSDYTLYEKAALLYGKAQGMNITLSAPDQVFAGESYTAKLNFGAHDGTYIIASISQAPLVYPEQPPDEKFRSLSDKENSLERVFPANATNNNEIITANIGLAQLKFDKEERPLVDYTGMARLIKRVNVLPISKIQSGAGMSALVERSANGKIDLSDKNRQKALKNTESDEEAPVMIEKSPNEEDAP